MKAARKDIRINHYVIILILLLTGLSASSYGHLTSLNPIRPDNSPDP